MNVRNLWVAALAAAGTVLGLQGCSVKNDASSALINCTPGANVFCSCVGGGGQGTKLCRPDGHSFDPCTTSESGECAGGEDVTSPGEGKPPPQVTTTTPPVPASSAADACPGQPTAVGVKPMLLEGDTTGAKDDAKGKPGACAVGGGGPDHVYHLQPTATGTLQIKVQGLGAMNPTAYLRSSCTDEATQLACAETTGAGGAEQLRYAVATGHDYYLYVDGASASAGKYSVTLTMAEGPVCGDGKIDANEACDDGNRVDGDGCSAGCNAVDGDPTTAGSCPGQPVHVWPGKVVNGAGSTVPFGNTFSATGSSCVVGTKLNVAQDHVYAVTAHAKGNLKVTVTPTDAAFNPMIVARTSCTEASTQSASMCDNSQAAGKPETVTFPVTNNQTVYIAADGALNSKGPYTVRFELL